MTSVAFQSILRKQIRKLPKILKSDSVKIIQYYSLLFIRVLSHRDPWKVGELRELAPVRILAKLNRRCHRAPGTPALGPLQGPPSVVDDNQEVVEALSAAGATDLVKNIRTNIYYLLFSIIQLQTSASIQPRASRLKFSNLIVVRQQTEDLAALKIVPARNDDSPFQHDCATLLAAIFAKMFWN